jgi:hypothetical protein
MNFLELLNKVARFAKPIHQEMIPLETLDIPFTETSIDSLDGLMILMYMCMIYDIDDETSKDFAPITPQELHNFIQQNKKRDPESIEWAMELIK